MGRKAEWDYYNIPTTSETARGGCLDSVIGLLSAGYFGVETTLTKPELFVRPGLSFPVPGVKSIDVMSLSSQLDKPVEIMNFAEFNSPQLSRKIVKNKKLS